MNKNKPSILVISSWYPDEKNDVFGSFVHEQVLLLKSYGHEVNVVKPNLNGTFKNTLNLRFKKNRVYNIDNIRIFEVNVNILIPFVKSLHFNILKRKTEKIIKSHNINFDIIHSHSILSGGIVGTYISEKTKKPLIHTEHSSDLIFRKEIDKLQEKQIIKLIYKSKFIIFVSKYARNHSIVYRKFKNLQKIITIHNPIKNSFFEQPFLKSENYILCIGEYSYRKNQDFLLKIWSKYKHQFPQDKLKLIFLGKNFQSISHSKINLNELNVEIIEKLDRNNTKELIGKSKLVVSVSKKETFGLTIAEAIALGIPVISTNSGGPAEIVNNQNGFLVNDNEDFYSKFVEILNMTFDKQKMRDDCYDRFSQSSIYNQIQQKYLEVLK